MDSVDFALSFKDQMILYKYLAPDRIDVLRNQMIRFTQPGDFNDPFEFRPPVQEIADNAHLQAYVEKNFDRLVDEEIAKYGAIVDFVPKDQMRKLLGNFKGEVPELFRMLQPGVLEKIRPRFTSILDSKVGVLCLSEIHDSILLWGHYAFNHRGYVIGFDSSHSFFSQRRTDADEFGFLRAVNYQTNRPRISLTETNSIEWFQTKSVEWSYEREWRIVRVLGDASRRIESEPFPICLFEFPKDAVVEIIIGLRAAHSLAQDIRKIAKAFPAAKVFQMNDDDTYRPVPKLISG